jgi:hypothetical protein
MKLENGSVHRKTYDGCCMKQQVKIPKVTMLHIFEVK